MPSRNVIKVDVSDSYYHIYARGHGRQAIFREEDYWVFLSLQETASNHWNLLKENIIFFDPQQAHA